MSREEIIEAMRGCAAELGRTPKMAEFRHMKQISLRLIRTGFGNYTRLIAESGLEADGLGFTRSLQTLFEDWGRVVRKVRKLPTIADYVLYGKYSARPMLRRFGTWSQTPAGMLKYAQSQGLEKEWGDVLKVIAEHLEEERRRTRTSVSPTVMPSQPRPPADTTIYGKPLHIPLNCSPTNENGVIFAFGAMARELGFSILHIQTAFPDCQALREVAPNQWQRVRIEFEYESRNFLTHMHPDSSCDLIVCWRHNWPECALEVLALEKVLEIG